MVYRGIHRPKVCYITLVLHGLTSRKPSVHKTQIRMKLGEVVFAKSRLDQLGASQNFSCPEPNDLYKMAICSWNTVFRKSKSHTIGFICRNACLFGNLCYIPIHTQAFQQQRLHISHFLASFAWPSCTKMVQRGTTT